MLLADDYLHILHIWWITTCVISDTELIASEKNSQNRIDICGVTRDTLEQNDQFYGENIYFRQKEQYHRVFLWKIIYKTINFILLMT